MSDTTDEAIERVGSLVWQWVDAGCSPALLIPLVTNKLGFITIRIERNDRFQEQA